MDKKGEVSLSFNWIYIAVIGGIILISSIYVVSNIRSAADKDLNFELNENLNLILNTMQSNTEGQIITMLPDKTVEMACDTLSIENQAISTRDMVMYSPNRLKEGMIGYSKFFGIPFRSVQITYLTSPHIVYLLTESGEAMLLNDSIPVGMNKRMITSPDFDNENFNKLRYIVFGDIPGTEELGNLGLMKDADISVVSIQVMDRQDKFPDSIGRVTYYFKRGSDFEQKGEVYFVDEATLLGAIIAEEPRLYECNTPRILKRVRLLLEIEIDRIAELSQFDSTRHCSYDESLSILNQLHTQLGEDFDPSYTAVYGLMEALKKENRYLQRLNCPQVF